MAYHLHLIPVYHMVFFGHMISVNQHILMEMILHGEESTNSSDEGVS